MSDSSSTLQENDSKSKSLEDQGEEIENPDSEKESLTKADQEPVKEDSSLLKEMNFMRDNFFEPNYLTYIEQIESKKSTDKEYIPDKRAAMILMGVYQQLLQTIMSIQNGQSTDTSSQGNQQTQWTKLIEKFENSLQVRDQVLINQKFEFRRYQQKFRSIYAHVIQMIEGKENGGIFKDFTKGSPNSSSTEQSNQISEIDKQICVILCHLELKKTLKEDKVSLGQHIKNQRNSEVSSMIKKFQDEIAQEQKESVQTLETYIDGLKKTFGLANIKIELFVKIFKSKMIQRYDPTLVSTICKKLLEVDLINISSATSTPINCKTNDWIQSVQNSSLKKRDYKEYTAQVLQSFQDTKKQDSRQSSPVKSVKSKQSNSNKKQKQEEEQVIEVQDKQLNFSDDESAAQDQSSPEIKQKSQKSEEKAEEGDEEKESRNEKQEEDTDVKKEQNVVKEEQNTEPKGQMKTEQEQEKEQGNQLIMQSISSSISNSQSREIQKKLELGSNNGEFSFNGNMGPVVESPKKSKQSPQKLSQKYSQRSAQKRTTLRIAPKKPSQKAVKIDDELDFVKPQNSIQPKFDTSKVDMTLELDDSQSSNEELKKHMTNYREDKDDGPSWNKSYASRSQNLSQVSSNSRVADLFNQMSKNNRQRRGRNFINRGSSMMLQHSQSQSQSACISQNASRAGSQFNSRINSRVNSGRNTPRGLKTAPNQQRISEMFNGSQNNRSMSPQRSPQKAGNMSRIGRIDTPAHGLKRMNNVQHDSQSVFNSLRQKSQMNSKPVNPASAFKAPMGPPRTNMSGQKQRNISNKMGPIKSPQNVQRNQVQAIKSTRLGSSPLKNVPSGKQSATTRRMAQLLDNKRTQAFTAGKSSVRNSERSTNPLYGQFKFDAPEDLFE